MNIVRTKRINNPSRSRHRNPVRCLLLVIGLLGGLADAAHAAEATQSAATPPPLQIDLDAFDARKKSVALPNGEVMAYIDMGNAAGPAVVFIHGYTDNARDWVPTIEQTGVLL
jgi:hypothetical protein